MRVANLEEAVKIWDNFFAETEHETFKCEVLQDYSAIDMGASLQAWLDGDKEESIRLLIEDNKNNEWGKQYAAKPIKKTRVHVVERPYTPYLEWEIEAYKHEDWGEVTHLVPKEKVMDLDIPDGDFWVFDNKRVVKFNYVGTKGKCVGADIYDEDDDIIHFMSVKEGLLKYGDPLKE